MTHDRYLATLDFEASSLEESGYPIEVAFVLGTADGIVTEFSTCIRSRRSWIGAASWSEASQAIHEISQREVQAGMDADAVCDLLNLALAKLNVVVDGGTFDTFWLARLYDGRPASFALDHLEGVDPKWFIRHKRDAAPRHRALPDARWLWETVAKKRFGFE